MPGDVVVATVGLGGDGLREGALLGEKFRISGFPIGTLQLQDAGSLPGHEFSGRLQADLYQMPQQAGSVLCLRFRATREDFSLARWGETLSSPRISSQPEATCRR